MVKSFRTWEALRAAVKNPATVAEPPNDWDVSEITNMARLFQNSSFNYPIADWDVSNVTDMTGMFDGAELFNQPLDGWDVHKVTSMRDMFRNTRKFNQPIGAWNVSNVTDMAGMFEGAKAFNQPLDGWNVHKVVTMHSMFKHTKAFNQPLTSWDVSNLRDMSQMFESSERFEHPIYMWKVANVRKADDMFEDTTYPRMLGEWPIFFPSFPDTMSTPHTPLIKLLATNATIRAPLMDSDRLYLIDDVCRDDLTDRERKLKNEQGHSFYRLILRSKTTMKRELIAYYSMTPADVYVSLIYTGSTFVDPDDTIIRTNAVDLDVEMYKHYRGDPSDTKQEAIRNRATNYGKHGFGLLCALACSRGLEVRLEVMNGRHNARAYCLYSRFGLHMVDANTGFTNYVYKMVSEYAADGITLEHIAAVIRDKNSHYRVPAQKFDDAYCGEANRENQEDMARLAYNTMSVYQDDLDNTMSLKKRTRKREHLLNYLRLSRRESLGKPVANRKSEDYMQAFLDSLPDDDGRLTRRQKSPTIPHHEKISPTESEFLESLSRPPPKSRKRQRT